MSEKIKKKGWLGAVERAGNLLPHPIYIFLVLTAIVIVLSALLSTVEFENPSTGETVRIMSLTSKEGLTWLLKNMTNNFIKFPALGMVIVTMLGVGLAEETGLLKNLLKVSIMGAPKMVVTAAVLFVGIMGNIAGSAIFVIVPPLGALMFKALGRHPIAGLAAGFAGVGAGLSANLIITPTDVINSGITESAAQIFDPAFTTNPAINWYFMAASTVLLTIVGTVIIEKIVEPKLGKYVPDGDALDGPDEDLTIVTVEQKKALKWAGIALVIYVVLVGLTIVPENGILRHESGSIVPSPFLDSTIPFLTGLFLFPSLAYGISSKAISNSRDVVNMFEKSISGLAGFITMCFFASQFVEYFSYSNIGLLVSVKGAEFLETSGFVGVPLIVCFIILVAFVNLFIGVLSAKWALLSPVFVPMFMKIGYTPYFTQAAFRIADSVTNIISPLEPFMPYMIMVAQKYDKKAGLGTIISTMLPLTIGFVISWTLLLIVWYVLNLPLGPGAMVFM